MGFLTLLMIIITGICLIIGVAGGFLRGYRRELLNLGLLVGVVVLAIVLRETITNLVLGFKVKGATVEELLRESIGATDSSNSFTSLLWPFVLILFSIIVFMAEFILFQILSIIPYILLRFIIRPGKDRFGERVRRPYIGMGIGLVSGVLLAVVLGNVVTGVSKCYADIESVKVGNQSVIYDLSNTRVLDMKVDLNNYNDSVLAKGYSLADPIIYDRIEHFTIEDKKYTLEGQKDGLKVALELSVVASEISDVDLSKGLTKESKDEIVSILMSLGESSGNLSEESEEMVRDLLKSVLASSGITTDISDFDITRVDFDASANVIDDAYKLTDENLSSKEQAKIALDLVKSVKQSNGVTVFTDMANIRIDLPTSAKTELNAAILATEGLGSTEAESLKKLFNLN